MKLLQEILEDLRSAKCLPGLCIGVICSLMVLVVEISFAAMIFSGPLGMHAQRAVGLTLAGSVIVLIVTALFSGVRTNISLPQDAPVAIFAGAAAGIALTVGQAPPEVAFMTVVAALILSTLATGGLFLLTGWLRLSEYIRFMPYPVVAGFLAGTGWLLTKGSLEVMTDMSLCMANLPRLLEAPSLLQWLPGAAYALVLFAALRRWSHFLILPGSLFIALILYHVILALSGMDLAQAREQGYFFASFSAGNIWPAFTPADLEHIQWGAVLQQLPTLAIIPFISLLGLLLNTGGLELAMHRDLDIERELRVNGRANVLGALVGSPAGYSALSLSLLGFKTNANTRIVGLTAGLILLLTLFYGGQILALFPKALLGGFLLLLGLFFLSDWIVDTRRRMPRADYLVVLAVFGTIGLFGYLQGVLLGLVTTVVLFVVRFSTIPAVRGTSSLATTRSQRQRPLPDQQLLHIFGHETCIVDLTGYLFFGSVNALSRVILQAAHDAQTHRIMINFTQVSGFDISAVNNFVRLTQRLAARHLSVALIAPPGLFTRLLQHVGGPEIVADLHFFDELNAAVEWAEDRTLQQAHEELATHRQGKLTRGALFDQVSDSMLQGLAKQEKVEILLDQIQSRLKSFTAQTGEEILSFQEQASGMLFIRQGTVRECAVEPENKADASTPQPTLRTLRTLGPDMFFAEPAAYEQWKSPHAYIAESRSSLALLTPQALRELESAQPQTALQIHRLVVGSLSGH
jgi:sulfate permease, SulP family